MINYRIINITYKKKNLIRLVNFMGKVKKSDIMEILDSYDKSDITIATLGSHTALHILRGAKQEGFKTAVVCEKGKEVPYERFGVADEFILDRKSVV